MGSRNLRWSLLLTLSGISIQLLQIMQCTQQIHNKIFMIRNNCIRNQNLSGRELKLIGNKTDIPFYPFQ